MKKDLGVIPAVYPMPALMVAAYDENGKVNVPIIEEYPVVMECGLAEIIETENVFGIVGKIVNTKAKEEVLDKQDRIDVRKLHALIFDQARCDYYNTGKKVAKAWDAGLKLMKE